jgi:hypothetical protein
LSNRPALSRRLQISHPPPVAPSYPEDFRHRFTTTIPLKPLAGAVKTANRYNRELRGIIFADITSITRTSRKMYLP